MAKKIQAIRGMHDILPEKIAHWQHLEKTVIGILDSYGYKEIRMPLLEMTDLFCRSIGEVTDIVEKEMYTFDDRNGLSLTLRPEGTASCVRASMENGLLHNQTPKLWYMGPMFRYEKPQKGRYRQFHQIGVETFGQAGADIDAELITMTARLWPALGLDDIHLEINSLGSAQARADYRSTLVTYLNQHRELLDEDSLRRLETNPLRILDSKNPSMQAMIEKAPMLIDCLDEESQLHFDRLRAYLDAVGIAYKVNPRLVRGLDYYSKTVFEWVTNNLGAQGTVCAGGRYDALVEQLGGKPTPASGFAMGVERLIALMEDADVALPAAPVHAYLITFGEAAELRGLVIAEQLRDAIPGLNMVVNCGAGSFKSQFKRADKSGAAWALVLGDDEMENSSITLKDLRHKSEQLHIAQADLTQWLTNLVNTEK